MSILRVGFVLPHFRAGGAERVVLNWIGALDRTRFCPVLFLARVEGAFLDLLPGDVVPVPLGAVRAIRLPRRIATALAAHRIDVAYGATNAVNLALLASPVSAGTARIVSEHTPPRAYLAEAKLPWLRKAAMRRFYPRADAVAVPTAAIADELAAMIDQSLATVVLPNPVVGSVAAIRPRVRRDGPLRLVSAGRLVPAKGFDTLIAACAQATAAGVALSLTVLGEGPLREALVAQAERAGIGGIVHLAGHRDRIDVTIAEADLFVLASRREGFGNVVVEAMAVGTPVLATRGGGPELLIRDRENGFLVAPDDPAALAAMLAALAADPARREAVREAAARTACGFEIAGATRVFEALVERVAAARSGAV